MREKTDGAILESEKALKSFLCYLYTGNEHPYYTAKSCNDNDGRAQENCVRSLDILASNKKSELVPIDKIKLAMDSELVRRPETLMFALAACARQRKSEKLCAAAYYFLAEHCKDWKYFILFIKYATHLCGTRKSEGNDDEKKKCVGWGRGWKNAVNKWYLGRDPTDFAILVGRYRGGCGWKHRDILRLSHVDVQNLDAEKRAVVKYVLDGHEAALKDSDRDPGATKQLDYLKRVDEFRRCPEPNVVAEKIISGKYTIDHVHSGALRKDKVWEALLPDMCLRTVLKYLPKIAELGFLTKSSKITDLVVQALAHEFNFFWSKVLPTEILEILNIFSVPGSIGGARKLPFCQSDAPIHCRKTHAVGSIKNRTKGNEREAKKVDRKILGILPDARIVEALRNALRISLKVDITNNSNKTYIIAIRLPKNECNACAEAGLSIAFPLINRDVPGDATTIIGYETKLGIGSIVDITKDTEFNEALSELVKIKKNFRTMSETMPRGPIAWCIDKKIKSDVFINVTTEPLSKFSIKFIRDWKIINDSKNSRFINVIINSKKFELKCDDWQDVLTINGFDSHVPFIIEAYVRGLFY